METVPSLFDPVILAIILFHLGMAGAIWAYFEFYHILLDSSREELSFQLKALQRVAADNEKSRREILSFFS